MRSILYSFLSLIAGLLVNYLADVLPQTRRLSRPEWWPPSAKSLKRYLAHSRVLYVLLVSLSLGYAFSAIPLPGWSVGQLALITIFFGVVVVIDIEHRAILHPVSAAGALLFAAIGILRHGLLSTLTGGLAGFLVLLLLYWFGDRFGAWLARRRGQPWEETALGFGDVNLAGVIGLLLGWPAILGGLMLSAIFGGLFSLGYIILMLARRRFQPFAAIPYGPFLALGALLLIILRAVQGAAL